MVSLREISNELHGDFGVSDGLGPFEIGIGLEFTEEHEKETMFISIFRDCQRGFVST